MNHPASPIPSPGDESTNKGAESPRPPTDTSDSATLLRSFGPQAADILPTTTPAADATWSDDSVTRCQALLGQSVCERLAIYSLPTNFVLSVIVPIYNEVQTVDAVIGRLRQTGIPMQIILVDDGSGDGTTERLLPYRDQPNVTLITHAHNRGKGAAVRSGLEAVRGDIIVIQDADQEYDPEDFRYLMQPILQGRADVVYGTRYGHADRQVSPLWHELVNAGITRLANLSLGIRLSDIETCYKMASRRAWESIKPQLRENRFGIEIELTARWARQRMRFVQRPIRYQHRWYAEGKKIGWRDGVAALGCIIRYGILRR
jgi:glycosyltransferase involved in cell wall biosynthesis